MARAGQSGAEHNTTAEALAGSGHSVVSSPVLGSRYAWSVTSVNPGTSGYIQLYHTESAGQPVYYKFDFQYTGASSSCWLLQWAYGTSKRGGIRMTGGTLQLASAISTGVGDQSGSLNTSTWYTVQAKYTPSSGDAEFYLDGVLIGSGNVTTAGNNVNNTYLGHFQPVSGTLYFDNWFVNNNTGSDDTGYPSRWLRLVYSHPNATMTEPATTGGGGGSLYWQTSAGAAASGTSSNWTAVEEVPPDDTDYVRKNSNNEFRDWYVIENISDIGYPSKWDKISSLAVGGRMGGNGTTSRVFYYKYETASGGTGIQTSSGFEANANAYFWYDVNDTINAPNWVTYPTNTVGADLDAYQIGAEAYQADSRQIRMAALWLEIAYLAQPRLLAITGAGV